MKLLNISFTKPRYWVLGLALATGAGTAQAQFTGIGTTAPAGALHVVGNDTTATLTENTLIVERIKRLNGEAAYTSVPVYDPATGIFRYETIAKLLDDNGEWIWDATNSRLLPRRTTIQHELNIENGAVSIGNATRSANLAVTGNGTISGTLGVTGNGTFTNDLTVNGNTALATGTTGNLSLVNLTRLQATAPAKIPGTTQVLIRNGSNVVEYAEIGDLLEGTGMWVENTAETELLPRVSTYAGTIGITEDSVNIKKNGHVGGTLIVKEATTLDSSLRVTGRVYLADVDNRANPIANNDRILMQRDGANLVEYVRVDSLLQSNGEWRFRAAVSGTNPDLIYANRANGDGNRIVATNAGRFGIGTQAPTQKLHIDGGNILVVDGNVTVDNDESYRFASIGSLAGDGTNLTLTATGAYAQAITGAHTLSAASSANTITGAHTLSAATSATTATGTITFQSGTGAAPLSPTVTINDNGLGIGVVAIAGRHLQTNLADGVQLGSLTAVTDLTTNLGVATPATTDDFRRVLITDDAGVVRYIDYADLQQESGEWRYEDAGTAGFDAGDYIYAFRALDNSTAKSVVVDFEGQFGIGTTNPDEKLQIVGGNAKLDVGQAFMWGGTTNQITNTALTVSAGFTFNTAEAGDVSFQEGTNAPWLHFLAANNGTDLGRVGIGTATPLASLHVVGNIVASHTAQTSDKRFKKDIVELSGALKAINALRGVSYEFRSDEYPKEGFDKATHIGFIAQEIREVLPQAVFERGDGYLTVDYTAVTPVLVEAMQELHTRILALEAENAALRSGKTADAVGAVSTKQLRDLEARLAAMDARLEAATAGRK